MRTTAIPANGL